MAVETSLSNYISTPDHADFTLPDGDWFWAIIVNPNVELYGQDILSTGEWGTSGTYNLYQFEDTWGFKYEAATAAEIATVSATDWTLLIAQRSGGNLSLRSVPMGGSTVTDSGNIAISGSVNPSNPLMLGRRSDSGSAPFLGKISDAFFVPGETISDSDMQDIADGTTAIDAFSWYSSASFWAIPETSTNTDYIGGKTLTVNGTLSSATDPADLVRFSGTTIDGTPGEIELTGVSGDVILSQIISGNIGKINIEGVAGSLVYSTGLGGVVGQVVENDTVFSVSAVKPIIATVGQVVENDSVFSVDAIVEYTISGNIAEIELSGVPGLVIATLGGVVGQVVENDTVFSVSAVKPIIATVGQVVENDSVFSVDAIVEYTISGNIAEIELSGVPGQVVASVTISGTPAKINLEAVNGASELTIIPPVPETNPGSNLYIIGNNLFDNATLTATSTASGFDKDNMKLDRKSSVWRSTDLSEQTITATWASGQTISAVAFAFSNLHIDSTVQIKLYTNSGDASAVYDSGELNIDYAYDAPVGFSTIGLNAFAFGGGTYFSHLFNEVECEKMELIVNSSGNPDDYIEISRIIAGFAFTPEYGARYGAEINHDDSTSILRTDAGDLVSNRGTLSKRINLTLGVLNAVDKQAMSTITRGRGAGKPVFASVYENSQNREERQAFMIYGVFNQLPGLNIFQKNRYSSTFSISEI